MVMPNDDLDALTEFFERVGVLRQELRAKSDLYATATIALSSEEMYALASRRDYNGRPYLVFTWEPDGSRACDGLRFSAVDDDHWIITVPRGLRGIDYI